MVIIISYGRIGIKKIRNKMGAGGKILIFNVNWLGDVLFSTAAIRNIRRNFPAGFIACIVPSRCYPVLKDNPYLDEVIIFDEKDRHRGILEKWRFVKLLKGKGFNKVFLLHRSFSRALISWLAGIPERVGHYTQKRSFLLTKNIPSPDRAAVHRIDYYLSIIEGAGLRVEDRYTEFFVSESDEKYADGFLRSKSVDKDDFLVGINPGGNWLLKRWPALYWARLADKLISGLKCKIILTGSGSDTALVREIQGAMRERPIVAAGALNIRQLGALCKRLDVFISADTGPLHIANAVGTKNIIAIFGPTSPRITGPYPLKNIVILQKKVGCKVPCYELGCKDNRCMKAIAPEEVIEKVRSLINK